MGVIQHDAIIATTWDEVVFSKMKTWIEQLEVELDADYNKRVPQELFLFSGERQSNGYRTITMIPDGSKEGWAASDYGDKLRDMFVAQLAKDDYPDGSSNWSWVEVTFGEKGRQVTNGDTWIVCDLTPTNP
jgi:hypothetical protein